MTGCLAGPDGPGECRALVPASTKISAAHETLVAHEQLVAKAQTSEPPAAAFAELVQL